MYKGCWQDELATIQELAKILPGLVLIEACLAALALQPELTTSSLIEQGWCCLAALWTRQLALDLVVECTQRFHGPELPLEQVFGRVLLCLSLLLGCNVTSSNHWSLSRGVEPPCTRVVPPGWLKTASVPSQRIEEINDDLLGIWMWSTLVVACKHLLLLSLGEELS